MNQIINGKREGYWEYHFYGYIISKGNYKNNLLEGYWEFYLDKNVLEVQIMYI